MKQIEVVAAIIHDDQGRIFATQRGYGDYYPAFHLTMHCYFCYIESGHLELKEHEAAKLLRKDELESVNWLPADWEVVKRRVGQHHVNDVKLR